MPDDKRGLSMWLAERIRSQGRDPRLMVSDEAMDDAVRTLWDECARLREENERLREEPRIPVYLGGERCDEDGTHHGCACVLRRAASLEFEVTALRRVAEAARDMVRCECATWARVQPSAEELTDHHPTCEVGIALAALDALKEGR